MIEGVAANWEELAYALHFTPSIVRTIRRDNPQDSVSACEEILYQWMSGCEGTRQPVTWKTLMESLRDCDFSTLADDLTNALL